MKVPGDTASRSGSSKFPADKAESMNASSYTNQQIFSVNKAAFYWRKMPSMTFIAGEEKSMPALKASKDRLTLSLAANTVVNFKLKAVLIYCSINPRAL